MTPEEMKEMRDQLHAEYLAEGQAYPDFETYLACALRHMERMFADNSRLTVIVKKFVKEQRITCPEAICQSDRVIENAYGLIDELCEVVGYLDEEEE